MERGPAGGDGAGSRVPGVRVPRRWLAAGTLAAAVLLGVIAVLATRVVTAPPAARAAAPRPSPTARASLTVPGIYQRVAPSVVTIQTGHELGSGVIVADNGLILTANHVVAGGGTITVTFADGTTANAAVAGADPKLDIAELVPAKLPQVVVPATVGGAAGVGASVVAIGNPLGLTDSVSTGVISGLDRTADTSNGKFTGLIQFDAAVNPGSSGGPLLDTRGLVIGVVVSIATPDGAGRVRRHRVRRAHRRRARRAGGKGPGKGPQI